MTTHPKHTLHEIAPQDLHDRLARHEVILIDVREAHRVHGGTHSWRIAVSAFDFRPVGITNRPAAAGRAAMRIGETFRDGTHAVRRGGCAFDTHLVGGIAAWKAAGLPTVTLDPGTGVVVDRQ